MAFKSNTIIAALIAATSIIASPVGASAGDFSSSTMAKSTVMSGCKVEPCPKSELDKAHDRIVHRHVVSPNGSMAAKGKFRWPWKKKKTEDKLKCC